MLGYMLRKMLNLLTIAKVLNIIAFALSLFIVVGGFITYEACSQAFLSLLKDQFLIEGMFLI